MIHDESTPDLLRDVLAANLRRLRIARHLSLSELARATRMSKATLSGIENGRGNPTVETLGSLAVALRVSVGELLEQSPLGEIRVVRAVRSPLGEQGRLVERPLEGVSPGPGFDVTEVTLPARHAHEADPMPQGSRVHVYVLEGKVIVGPVERITELGPGDYASFPADVPHVFEAGRRAARLLLLSPSGP